MGVVSSRERQVACSRWSDMMAAMTSPACTDVRSNADASRSESELDAPRLGRLGAWLLVASVAMLTSAGLLLWATQGPAVFSEVVLAALAWCF